MASDTPKLWKSPFLLRIQVVWEGVVLLKNENIFDVCSVCGARDLVARDFHHFLKGPILSTYISFIKKWQLLEFFFYRDR